MYHRVARVLYARVFWTYVPQTGILLLLISLLLNQVFCDDLNRDVFWLFFLRRTASFRGFLPLIQQLLELILR